MNKIDKIQKLTWEPLVTPKEKILNENIFHNFS